MCPNIRIGRAGRKSSSARDELNMNLSQDLKYAFEHPSSMDEGVPKLVEMGSFVKKIGSKYVLSEYQRQDNNWCGSRKFGFIMAVCKGTADLQITCLMVPAQDRRVTRSTQEEVVYHIWDGGHRCHTLYAFVTKNEPVHYSSSNIPLFFNEPTVEANPTFFRKYASAADVPDDTPCFIHGGEVYTLKCMSYTVFTARQRETFLENRNVTCMTFNNADVSPDDMSKYIVDRHLGQKPEQGEIIQMMRATKTPALDTLEEVLKRNVWITSLFANKAIGVKMLSYMLLSVHEDTKQGSTSWLHRNIFSFFLPTGTFTPSKKETVLEVFDHIRPIVLESKLKNTASKQLVLYITVAMGFALANYWDRTENRKWRLTCEDIDTRIDYYNSRKGLKIPSLIHVAKEFANAHTAAESDRLLSDGEDDDDDGEGIDKTRVQSIDSDDDDETIPPKRPCVR